MATTSPLADTLHLVVRPSAAHRLFLTSTHLLGALVACALLWYGRLWVLLFLPCLALSAVHGWRVVELSRSASIRRLRAGAGGRWTWQCNDERWREGELVGAFVASTWLVVLSLRESGHRWRRAHCVLFRDALAADSHRRLRARLTVLPPADADFDDR